MATDGPTFGIVARPLPMVGLALPGVAPGADDRLPFAGGDVEVACDQVWHPAGPAQPSALLVATFDASTPATGGRLDEVGAVEVAGAGQALYGTAEALYVATTLWAGAEPATSIHRFSLDDLAWTGSGRVPGTPLNQFAFDEHQGVLRVAVTHDQPVASAGRGPAGEVIGILAGADVDNLVITLDTAGDLDEVGRVGGLGKPGERIQGVRFAGGVGYVVTFRQTDPFYVIDLSDPASPKAVGELELPGFSAYLHPMAGGLVVGIGQAGTETGRLLGAQAQLFDVSDPRTPRLVDQELLGTESPALFDHLAFASLGGSRFAVPVSDWAGAVRSAGRSGAPVVPKAAAIALDAGAGG
ncbi:MAG: beta-propeller domain-containing protein, partial [Acidimicrobiales bacterium]